MGCIDVIAVAVGMGVISLTAGLASIWYRHMAADLRQARAVAEDLAEVVHQYLSELDNPAPDFGMRGVYRGWMRELADRTAWWRSDG